MNSEFRPEDYIRSTGHTEPDPAEAAHLAAKPQPHLGYTLLLLLAGFLALVIFGIGVTMAGIALHVLPRNAAELAHGFPKTSILIEALTFAATFAFAMLVFPRMWRRSFNEGIAWHRHVAVRYAGWLAGGGIALSVVAQLLESRLNLQKKLPIDEFFQHPADVWVVALFGTLVAPACEEIFFRGFLLRGLAIGWDWCAARLGVQETDSPADRWFPAGCSRTAWIVAGVISSGLFAAMHAAQLGFAWNAVGVLWLVGGALTVVRVRLNSVAASTLVHAAYNGFLFALLFFASDGFRHLDKLSTK